MFSLIRSLSKKRLYISSPEFRLLLFASILFVIGAMSYVWPNVKMVKLAYEHQILEQEHQSLLNQNQLVKLERDSLQSLYRIETLAKNNLGLRAPEKYQVITIFLK